MVRIFRQPLFNPSSIPVSPLLSVVSVRDRQKIKAGIRPASYGSQPTVLQSVLMSSETTQDTAIADNNDIASESPEEDEKASLHTESTQAQTNPTEAEPGATATAATAGKADITETAGTAGKANTTGNRSSGGFVAGAIAIVSAGLGLSSVSGTWLGDMLRARAEIVGQIEASSGTGGGNPVDAVYTTPWNTVALANGAFALVAVVLGGLLLLARGTRADTPTWVKAVTLGGIVLGLCGLFVSGGMYFDLFASKPQMPTTPGLSQ